MQSACADLPSGRYANNQYGYNFSCPAAFNLYTHEGGPFPSSLMSGRIWDPKHVGGSGYPEGQIEFHVNAEDAPNLRDWVASHAGTGPDPNHQHYWDSTSNEVDVSVAGAPALAK